MTTRLELYNHALLLCGEQSISSLTEDRLPRRLLDSVWDNGGVKKCLEAGQWNFAMRAVRLDFDTAVDPSFGYRRAFQKPTDWCATSAVCSDEYFNNPLLQYVEETGYWFCDQDELFIKYVSNDPAFGGDLSIWPGKFEDYVATYFASKIIFTLTSDENKLRMFMGSNGTGNSNGLLFGALKRAKSHDMMADPTIFPAQGGWSKARGGRPGGDRGGRGSLTG